MVQLYHSQENHNLFGCNPQTNIKHFLPKGIKSNRHLLPAPRVLSRSTSNCLAKTPKPLTSAHFLPKITRHRFHILAIRLVSRNGLTTKSAPLALCLIQWLVRRRLVNRQHQHYSIATGKYETGKIFPVSRISPHQFLLLMQCQYVMYHKM
jgi:hypothetical protein